MCIIVVNAIIAGLISGTGVVLAQMANGGGAMPTNATWLVAGLTALASAGKDWQSHVSVPPGYVAKIVAIILLASILTSCSGLALLNQNNTEEQTRKILEMQNARGCIYFYGTAAPWASVKTVIVGTWGQDPPPYAECWQGIPPGM